MLPSLKTKNETKHKLKTPTNTEETKTKAGLPKIVRMQSGCNYPVFSTTGANQICLGSYVNTHINLKPEILPGNLLYRVPDLVDQNEINKQTKKKPQKSRSDSMVKA